jgi:phage baseplate assembly protein V
VANMTERGMRALLDPLRNRVAMMAARALVRLVDDTGKRQRVQVEALKGELRDGVERPQNYGFTAHPFAGADAFLVCLGGSREQTIALVVDDRRYRLLLQEGEVAMYDDQGQAVKLLRDRIHVLTDKEVLVETTATVRIEAATAIINADLQVNGDTTFTGQVTANGKRIDETHKHTGVSAGAAQSGTVA